MPAGLKVWELIVRVAGLPVREGPLWIYDAARDEYYSERKYSLSARMRHTRKPSPQFTQLGVSFSEVQ